MNGLGKPFRKKSDPKNRENSENQSEIAACEQKTSSEKANFCSNTFFSLYFKFRAKKIHAAKSLAFLLHFLFRRDQNHYFNLTSKIMKMCEQILQKKYNSNSLNCKNQEHRNIATLSLQLRSYKNKQKAQAIGLKNVYKRLSVSTIVSKNTSKSHSPKRSEIKKFSLRNSSHGNFTHFGL